jgi:hypothetical protein
MNMPGTETTLILQPLKLWEKVRIIVGAGPDAGIYAARIEDFVNGGMVMTAPEFISGNILLRDDIPVVAQITRNDAIYQFETRIRKYGAGTAGQVSLAAPRDFRRVQRRLFVRIELRETVEYAQLTAPIEWGLFPQSFVWNSTVMHDISGGGLRLTAVTPANVGDVFLLRLPKIQGNSFPDYVVAICRRVWDEQGVLLMGLEFILEDRLGAALGEDTVSLLPVQARRFDRKVQNRLVVWVFHRQIELRQKGLL